MDQAIAQLTTAIQTSSKRNIPSTTTNQFKPKLPPQYLNKIQLSRKAYKEYIRTRSLEALRLHRQYLRLVQNYIRI